MGFCTKSNYIMYYCLIVVDYSLAIKKHIAEVQQVNISSVCSACT